MMKAARRCSAVSSKRYSTLNTDPSVTYLVNEGEGCCPATLGARFAAHLSDMQGYNRCRAVLKHVR